MDQIWIDSVRIGSDFRLNTIDFFRVSGHFGSGRVEFQVLMSLFWASGHSGPGRIEFRII
jgi:hypothetical protein